MTRRKPIADAHRQVAALAYRPGATEAEVLLVTSRETQRWVLPKGWPMAGREDWDAAAQEAFEEAGVAGSVDPRPIGRFSYFKRLRSSFRLVDVTVYPLRVTSTAAEFPERGQRMARWVSAREASDLVDEPGLKALLLTLAPAPGGGLMAA